VGSYFNFLIRKTSGKSPDKKKKTVIKPKTKITPKKSLPKIRFRAESSVMAVIMPIIMGMIMLVVLPTITSSLNVDAISPGAVGMLDMIPMAMGFVVGIMIIGALIKMVDVV